VGRERGGGGESKKPQPFCTISFILPGKHGGCGDFIIGGEQKFIVGFFPGAKNTEGPFIPGGLGQKPGYPNSNSGPQGGGDPGGLILVDNKKKNKKKTGQWGFPFGTLHFENFVPAAFPKKKIGGAVRQRELEDGTPQRGKRGGESRGGLLFYQRGKLFTMSDVCFLTGGPGGPTLGGGKVLRGPGNFNTRGNRETWVGLWAPPPFLGGKYMGGGGRGDGKQVRETVGGTLFLQRQVRPPQASRYPPRLFRKGMWNVFFPPRRKGGHIREVFFPRGEFKKGGNIV